MEPHSIHSYIFICTTFLLKHLVNQYKSAKHSSASAVKWESLSRGGSLKLSNAVIIIAQCLQKQCHRGSGRWSSTSIQMSTINPCGEDLMWWWAWGNPAALGWEKAERQENGSGHLVYQDNIEKKFHGREQCHRNKQGGWWDKGVGSSKTGWCPAAWTSEELPVSWVYHTPQQKGVIWLEIQD